MAYKVKRSEVIDWETFDQEISQINNYYLSREAPIEPLDSAKARAVIEFLNKDSFNPEEELYLLQTESIVSRGAVRELPRIMLRFRARPRGWFSEMRKNMSRTSMVYNYAYATLGINDLYRGLVARNFLSVEE